MNAYEKLTRQMMGYGKDSSPMKVAIIKNIFDGINPSISDSANEQLLRRLNEVVEYGSAMQLRCVATHTAASDFFDMHYFEIESIRHLYMNMFGADSSELIFKGDLKVGIARFVCDDVIKGIAYDLLKEEA